MPSLIIPVLFLKLYYTSHSNVHTSYDSWKMGTFYCNYNSFFLILFEKQHFAFMFIISLLFDYIKPYLFPIILLLCLQASYYSSIIPIKFVTYDSQNYAGIIGSSLKQQ